MATSQLYAEDSLKGKLQLTADSSEYQQDSGGLIASGNVEIHFKNYLIKTDEIRYEKSSDQKILQLINHIEMKKDIFNIQARIANYNLTIGTGNAYDVKADLGKIKITGQDVALYPDRIELYHTSFTSCKEPTPHYYIKSDSLQIYPQVGLFITNQNFLYIGDTPIFYFPTYIYASQAYSILAKNSPIPEIGSNEGEGNYIKGKIGYFINPALSGTIDYGYTETFHSFIGLTQEYKFSMYHNLEWRIHYHDKYGYQGGLFYSLDFIKRAKANMNKDTIFEELLSQFMPEKDALGSLFLIQYSFHQLENNFFIDYLPLIKVQLTNFSFPVWNSKLDADINVARIGEHQKNNNPVLYVNRFNINTKLMKETEVKPFIMRGELFYNGSWYQPIDVWHRAFFKASIAYNDYFIKPKISYTKMLYNQGKSPLLFDSTNTELTDEIGYQLKMDLNNHADVTYEAYYDIFTTKPRALDLIITWGVDCWSMSLKGRFVQKEVGLNVELY